MTHKHSIMKVRESIQTVWGNGLLIVELRKSYDWKSSPVIATHRGGNIGTSDYMAKSRQNKDYLPEDIEEQEPKSTKWIQNYF